tara:strand:+ start:6133 stop:6372 length:240 start_codon:yes stop_codon:yes gene_type:complete
MEKVLQYYFKNKKDVQLFIREKLVEGTIESLNDGIVHLVGEKYEYHIPIKNIVILGCKLDKNKRRLKIDTPPSLGFQLA